MNPAINVHLTNNCNYNCDVCFENKDSINPKYLDKTKLLNFIDTLESKHIGFVGGEPLLHPNINEILSELSNNGVDTCVVTNGEYLSNLTVFPNTLSIGIDNYDQVNVDTFISNNPLLKSKIEITITPTDISVLDSLIQKYKDMGVRNVSISLLAFWNKNSTVSNYINDGYIEKIVSLINSNNVTVWGENNEHYLRMFYANYWPKDKQFHCIAPLNIYSDGHLEFCDLENFPLKFENGDIMTYDNYDVDLIVKNWDNAMQNTQHCKCCNLRRQIGG